MHDRCLIAEFANVERARQALEMLARMNLGEEHISFVSRSDDPALGDIGELEEGAAEPMGKGTAAGIGALIGGALAIPLTAPTLMVPFIFGGPIVGAGLGAALGGMLGGAHRWGVTEEISESYQKSVEQGAVLVIVSGSAADLMEAEASLKTLEPRSLKHFAKTEH